MVLPSNSSCHHSCKPFNRQRDSLPAAVRNHYHPKQRIDLWIEEILSIYYSPLSLTGWKRRYDENNSNSIDGMDSGLDGE